MRDEDRKEFNTLWDRAIRLPSGTLSWSGNPGYVEGEARLYIYPHGYDLRPLRPKYARAILLMKHQEDLVMLRLPRIPYEELLEALDVRT